MKPQICVVGSFNMDLVFRTPRMPAVGETLHGHEFRQIPGGKGANQAVAAARQGAHVHFVGAVGDDGFSANAREALSADQISLNHLHSIPATATGVAGILVDDAGSNSIVLAAGANACLSTAHIDAAADSIRQSAMLICQLETPMATVTYAIRTAKQANVAVVLNPAPAQALDSELLAMVDYLILNETEAGQLSGINVTDRDSAQRASEALLAMGIRVVLLTMGGDGAIIAEAGNVRFVPAVRVSVVDTTAAGDTFVGAFAVGIANGLTLDQAVTEAQYTAAITVTRLGAQTSIPQRAEVLALMKERQAA